MDDSPRHGHPLTLAPREQVGAMTRPFPEADARKSLGHARPSLAGRAAADRQRALDVLAGGQDGDQVEALEDETDVVTAEACEGRHVLAKEAEASAAGLVDATDEVEERALAAAARSRHREELARRDVEGDNVGVVEAVAPADGIEASDRFNVFVLRFLDTELRVESYPRSDEGSNGTTRGSRARTGGGRVSHGTLR